MNNTFLKKTIWLLSFLLIQFSYGQSAMGIEAGVNLVSPKSDLGLEGGTGYHIGLTYDLHFSPVFSFETGVFYSHKTIEDDYGDNLKLGYLDIPLTLKLSFGIGSGNTKLYIAGGGFVNWGMNGKGKVDGDDIDIWQDDGTYLERYDFGVTAGAGIEIGAIQIGGAYDMGLYNISHGDEDLSLDVIKISLGYRFM